MRNIFCILLLLLTMSFISQAQIRTDAPVFIDDFGTVPDNWKSRGTDYSDGSNLNTLRLPLDFDGKYRGTVSYGFPKRVKERNWACQFWGNTWWNNTMADMSSGNGKYALAVNGTELGSSVVACITTKTWHNQLNHSGENGLALLVNGKEEDNSLVLENVIDNHVTLGGVKITPGQLYEFRVYFGNAENGTAALGKPQIETFLESGGAVVPYKTGDLGATAIDQPIAWQEVRMFKEALNEQIKYSFKCVKNTGIGNVFVVDDISLSPISVRADVVNVDFCKYPGKVCFETSVGDIPEGLKVWSRMMRKQKGGGEWEWVGGNAVDSLCWLLPDTDYLKYDFRMAVGLSEGNGTSSRALDVMDLNNVGYINEYGPYSVSDQFVTQDYCLTFGRITPDYTSVTDSVSWSTDLNNIPEGATVYSRWMWQPFGGGEWVWWETPKEYSHNPIDWVTFTTGNFRCVYAFSPELLNVLDCNVLNSRELYCISSEFVPGSDYMMLLSERFDGGAAILEAEVTGAPMGANIYACWMQRPRSGGGWTKMSSQDVLTQKIGLVTYSENEYRVAVTLSFSVGANLDIQNAESGVKEYRLSEVFAGRDYRLGDIPVDFCRKPGEVVKEITFASDYPEDVPVHGRWMQREKGGDSWTWKDPIVNKIPAFNVAMADYLSHDYSLVLSWSRDSLLRWQADALPESGEYYLVQDIFKPDQICLGVDTIEVISRKKGEFVLHPQITKGQEEAVTYGRWMRIRQGDTEWEWLTNAVDADYDLTVSINDFGDYSYRFYAAFAQASLDAPVVMMWDKPYFAARTITGHRVYQPEVTGKELTCVAKQDKNKILLTFENRGDITSFTYRIGDGGIVRQESFENEVEFTITEDKAFYLLSYAYRGVADSIIVNDTLKFTYLPKLKIDRLGDVFTCANGTVELSPSVSGMDKPVKEWFRNNENVSFSMADTLRMHMTETGTIPVKLVVSGEGVCPEDSTVSVITAEHPEIEVEHMTEVREVCVGQEFTIKYNSIDAEQYRIALKSTTMPDFVFYPGTGAVGEGMEKLLQVKSGQTALTATDFMVGHEFTFVVQIFKIVNYNGASYRCQDEFEYTFRVRQNPVSKFAPVAELCNGSRLELNPEVDPQGNRISQYRWQFWDGRLLEAEVIKTSDVDCSLSAVVDGAWNGKRLQLVTLSECGEVTVQDMALAVYTNDSNRISGPERIVITGEKGTITGTDISLKDVAYQWECKSAEGNWEVLTGEGMRDLAMLVPEVSGIYRRSIISDVYRCENMSSNEVFLTVFDREQENIIYIYDKDTLVYSGTAVTVHSDSPEREGIGYLWQRYDFGTWAEIPGEHGRNLTCVMDEITMVRRVAVVGDRMFYSNPVVINVYDSNRNKILYTGGLVVRGSQIQVAGNFVDIPGVRYTWYGNEGAGWKLMSGQNASKLSCKVERNTSFVRYVYLPSQPEDSLRSNEVSVFVFDNAEDNLISCESRNVCIGEQVSISGKAIEADGVVWRWECSYDNGNVWEIMDGQSGPYLTFIAQENVSVRRTLLYGALQDCFSNVLGFNVIHNSADNVIGLPGIVFAGKPVTIQGSEVKNASYSWEVSENGEDNWTVCEGEHGQTLSLGADMTTNVKFFRRKLEFKDEEIGCAGKSNVLKLAVLDENSSNMIVKPEGNICRWAAFTIVGADLSDFGAKYQWYSNSGDGWQPVDLGFEKDLNVFEGIGRRVLYRRDATIEEKVYESNVATIDLWEVSMLKNIVKNPGVACSGSEVLIKGSDVMAEQPEMSGFFKSYLWEESVTGAGGTWESTDSVTSCDLLLRNAGEPKWYRRVIETYCGDENRSLPIFLDVKEHLPLTLRHDATSRLRKVKEPIAIFVDEDFYTSYEFKIDGKVIVSAGQKSKFYGWMPEKDYKVVVNVLTESGCMQTDTLKLRTPDIDLPNVLTPNDDGYNDVLLSGYDLKVFNRWGSLMYSGTAGWDGRYKGEHVAAGTYFYIIRLTQENGMVSEYKRSVTVKR